MADASTTSALRTVFNFQFSADEGSSVPLYVMHYSLHTFPDIRSMGGRV